MMKINTVWLTITSKCNNNCVFCYYKTRNQEISLTDIKDYIKLFKKIKPKKIILIGGEPTIHPDFEKIINLFFKNNIKVNIVSNGFGFKDENLVKKISSKINNIALSIEGTKRIHNKIVNNKNAHTNIIKSIKNIKKYKKKVLINTVINKNNIKNISRNISYLHKLDIRSFSFNICTSFKKSNVNYSPKELITEFEPILRKLIKKYPDSSFKILTSIPKCVVPKDLQTNFTYGCHIFSNSGLIIDSNNEILLCTHWVDYPLAKISPKITFKNFKIMWQKIQKYRTKISKRPIKECSKCILKKGCYGGCPIFWKLFNPKTELKMITKYD
jgi:radical SAM protein with 4Fe4S-binding SPASM domain